MKQFLIRFSFFISIWVLFYFFEDSNVTTTTLLITCSIIILYFFLPVTKFPFIHYCLLHSLTLLFYFHTSTSSSLANLLLFFYFTIEAMFKLKSTQFKMLIASTYGAFVLLYLILGPFDLEKIIILGIFYFVVVKANETVAEKIELRKLYDELLSEYRKLKRQSFLSEKEARLEERTKIARDIHDSVGHKLTALLMQIEIMSLQHGEEQFRDLKKLADESLQETRKAVRAFQTEEAEGFTTILQLIKKLESESHIKVHFTTKGGVLSAKLTNEESVVLYRVIQEGLTNAMRHAHSREVQVTLSKTAIGDIELIISNSIHEQKPFHEGFGIKNMRKRLEDIDGELQVYIAEGKFIVKAKIPLKNGNQV